MEAISNIGVPPSIMIVDDTPANLEVLSDALTESGYRVRSAPSGRLALQAALSDPPDLILLDIMMPEMDGYEVCRILKEDGVTRDIPVIFITAMDRDMDEERGLSLGAVDYITKPIRLPIVMARVQNHLQMKMQRDGIEAEVMARTAELDAANRELKSEIAERARAEEERERTLIQQDGVNLLQQSLLAPAPLDRKLRSITDSIVRIFDADFCRIWLIRPGDLCEQGCVHEQAREGPHVCRYRDRCLHLLSSSGRYTHIDGAGHRRVPFGCYKIGLVASGEDHKFITNDVQNDPRIHNHEWARELGLVSFAGYQLRVTGGQTMGVMALFARHPIAPVEDAMLDGVSGTVALVVQQAEGQEALSMSEEKFRGLFESSRDAIMTLEPPSWSFTSGNQATVAMFRAKSIADFISRTPGDLSPERQPDGSASAEKAGEMIETAMSEGSTLFEWTHRRLDGEDFPVTVLLTRVDLEGTRFLQATVRDITGQKQAETDLRRKNEELDLLLNSITSILIGVSTADIITHWNYIAEQTFGIPAAEAVGNKIISFIIDWEWEKICIGISSCVMEKCPVKLSDLRYTDKNGRKGLLGITINPIQDDQDVLKGFLIFGNDITERRMVEQQLLQSSKMATVGEMATGVAHELNQPLNVIKMASQFMLDGINEKYATEAFLQERVGKIIVQVDRAAHIINHLREFGRKSDYDFGMIDPNQPIRVAFDMLAEQLRLHSIIPVLDLDDSLPSIRGDIHKLEQVFINMIVNAKDAFEEMKNSLQEKNILVKSYFKEQQGIISIEFSDNGPGIPEDIRDRIFEPFFTTKEVGKGTGLGLSISYGIIKAHRGEIEVVSNSSGTVFTVSLPVDGGHQDAQ